MSIQRAKLAGSKKRRQAVHPERIARCVKGEISWVEALGVSAHDSEALRAFGRALCHAGKYREALHALSALPLLGLPDRLDPLYLGVCYEAIGDQKRADQCFLLVDMVHTALERELAQAGSPA